MLMNRVKQIWIWASAVCSVGLISVIGLSSVAHADHGLTGAAQEYREAALGLERHVHRLSHVDHYVKRLVSRLEDAACDFKSASHDPGNVSRLNYQWDELQSLHLRVEQALAASCASDDVGLRQCWWNVQQAYQCVYGQMRYLTGGLPDSQLPPWQTQRPPHCNSNPGVPNWYGQVPQGKPGMVPPVAVLPGSQADLPPVQGPVVLPATPFGTTLGTLPFQELPHRPYQSHHSANRQPVMNQQPSRGEFSRGELGAAIAVGLLQSLLNR